MRSLKIRKKKCWILLGDLLSFFDNYVLFLVWPMMWCVILIYFLILSNPCIPEVIPTWLCWLIILIYFDLISLAPYLGFSYCIYKWIFSGVLFFEVFCKKEYYEEKYSSMVRCIWERQIKTFKQISLLLASQRI